MEYMGTSDIASELSSLFNRVVGKWTCGRVESVLAAPSTSDRVGMDLVDGRHQAWVLSRDLSQRITVSCSEEVLPAAEDLSLMRRMVAVLNYDLKIVGESLEGKEIWIALSQSRFLRAASRLSQISTGPLLKRIRIFEAAARQTYEGSPFIGSVIMPHNVDIFRKHAGERYRPFAKSLAFDQALLREKWLRPFLEGGDFALVAAGPRGNARGFTDASLPWPNSIESAPIAELEGLYGYLRPGISVLSASPAGDIYFSLSTGVTFLNSKGQWRYQNWSPLVEILSRHFKPDVVQDVIRLVRSASYLHKGALYVVLDGEKEISSVVPDHRTSGRSTETLRSTVNGINVQDPIATRLLNVAARIDGAVVLDGDGRVLDVASMIAEPTLDALKRAEQNKLQRFAGARTTAAWNASIHGLAIKVSDDGPVDVYEGGRHIFHTE